MPEAKGKATLEIETKDNTKGFFKKFLAALKKLGGTTAKVGLAIGAAYAGMTAAAVKFGGIGVKFKTIENSFTALADSQGQDSKKMLNNMRKLSAGTITDMDLMKEANNALLLGLPVERMGDIIKMARGAAAAMGTSVEFQLKSLVTGLGRGSKLMLDNAGIIVNTSAAYQKYADKIGRSVNALSDQQKKTAFINESLRIGTANLKKQGGVTVSAADKWKSFGVTMENIKNKLSVLVIPAFKEAVTAMEPMIKAFETLSDHPFVKESAILLTKGFTIFGVALETATAIAMEKLMPFLNALPHLFKGNFVKAKEVALAETKSLSDILVDQKKQLGERLLAVDKNFLELDKEVKGNRKVLEEQERLDKIAADEAATIAALEAKTLANQNELALAGEHQDAMLGQSNKSDIAILQQSIKAADKRLKTAIGFENKQRILRTKASLQEQLTEAQKEKAMLAARGKTLSTIASMANSSNSKLAAIGKAAGLVQIAIATPVAISQAMKAFPPPFNFAAAGAVAAAMAAQAAQLSGIALADGGIVGASPGGTSAIIGEGGRDEAVVPLPDDFDPDQGLGGGITINVNGGMLGDEASAREFALAVDNELMKLRENNESNAFDEDLS